MATYVVFEADKVQFTHRDRNIYNSSPGVGRGFCAECGTPLTWEGKAFDRTIIEFHISTLDNPEDDVRTMHWFHSERIDWFEAAYDLPRYRGISSNREAYQIGQAFVE